MNMSNQKVIQLTEEKACSIMRDASIVAIRWDIEPWSLVLDLDVPVTESDKAEVQRAWIAFKGVSMVDFPLSNARLPIGVSVVSEMWIEDNYDNKGLRNAIFQVVFSQFSSGDMADITKTEDILIVAKNIIGAVSIASSPRGEFNIDWEKRNALASDNELRRVIAQ